MLPASGACTPKMMWPRGLRPRASLNRPCSTMLNPSPPNSTGWFGAQSSIWRTLSCALATAASSVAGSPWSISPSSGMTSASMNVLTIARIVDIFSESSKSMDDTVRTYRPRPIGTFDRGACVRVSLREPLFGPFPSASKLGAAHKLGAPMAEARCSR